MTSIQPLRWTDSATLSIRQLSRANISFAIAAGRFDVAHHGQRITMCLRLILVLADGIAIQC